MSAASGEGTILFGGSGFMGPYILRNHPAMISVGRTPPPTGNRHVHVDGLGDLRALHDLEFDKVIYIVGHTDHHALERETLPEGEPTAFDYHVVPFLQTMEQIKDRPLRKLLHFSTILIYDEKRLELPVSEDSPIDPYKNRYVFSKHLAEEACRFYSGWVPIINVRMSNLYGPIRVERYDLIHVLIRQLLREGRGEVWSIRPERDFIHVADLADAHVRTLQWLRRQPAAGLHETFNLGSGSGYSVRQAIAETARIAGKAVPHQVGPRRPGDSPRLVGDIAKARRVLGWQPSRDLTQQIDDTLRWRRKMPR